MHNNIINSSNYDSCVDCVFCKLVNKELPVDVLDESPNTLTILDANPVTKGHCLVISKQHFTDTQSTPDEVLAEIIQQAKKAGVQQKEQLQATGFNILTANGKSAQQSVFHVHYHVIPRKEDDDLDLWFHG